MRSAAPRTSSPSARALRTRTNLRRASAAAAATAKTCTPIGRPGATARRARFRRTSRAPRWPRPAAAPPPAQARPRRSSATIPVERTRRGARPPPTLARVQEPRGFAARAATTSQPQSRRARGSGRGACRASPAPMHTAGRLRRPRCCRHCHGRGARRTDTWAPGCMQCESGEMSALADVATAHPFYFAMVFWLLSLRRGCLYVSM